MKCVNLLLPGRLLLIVPIFVFFLVALPVVFPYLLQIHVQVGRWNLGDTLDEGGEGWGLLLFLNHGILSEVLRLRLTDLGSRPYMTFLQLHGRNTGLAAAYVRFWASPLIKNFSSVRRYLRRVVCISGGMTGLRGKDRFLLLGLHFWQDPPLLEEIFYAEISQAVIIWLVLARIRFNIVKATWYLRRTTSIIRGTEMPVRYQVLHLKRLFSVSLHATLKRYVTGIYVKVAVFWTTGLTRLHCLSGAKILTDIEHHVRLLNM